MLKILFLGLFIMTILNAQHTNSLENEDSPYLQQHAHNPVNWYPWGDKAFEKAKKENKLIFLSIGYSTCHWCHVMERESFENEEVAKILNKDFISIKVDREEYPHIDRYYQDIYMIMNRRSGGWPLTIIMTPNAKTFFSGTYIPSDDRYDRSGLKGLLKNLKTYLQSLLSNVVLKSTKENLIQNRKLINQIKYPFVLLKPTKDQNFLACKIDHCFAMDKELAEVIKKIK